MIRHRPTRAVFFCVPAGACHVLCDHYFSYYLNSLKYTFLQTALTLLFSSFVAYGFAMYRFRGQTVLFGLVLLMMTTAVEILMLPLFLEMQ